MQIIIKNVSYQALPLEDGTIFLAGQEKVVDATTSFFQRLEGRGLLTITEQPTNNAERKELKDSLPEEALPVQGETQTTPPASRISTVENPIPEPSSDQAVFDPRVRSEAAQNANVLTDTSTTGNEYKTNEVQGSEKPKVSKTK